MEALNAAGCPIGSFAPPVQLRVSKKGSWCTTSLGLASRRLPSANPARAQKLIAAHSRRSLHGTHFDQSAIPLLSNEGRRNRERHRRRLQAMRESTQKIGGQSPLATTVTTSTSGDSDTYITSITSALQSFPWRKIFVWAIVALTMVQLREFLGILMGTFILSFIGNALVGAVEQQFPERRRLVVLGMYSIIVAVLVGIGILAIPRIISEGGQIIYRIQQNENPYTLLSDKLRDALGEGVVDQLERFLLVAVSSSDANVLDLTVASSRAQRNLALQKVINDYSGELVSFLTTALAATSRYVLQCAVSLIFSFMIVWDLPAISAGVESLRSSRLAIVYEEIAPAAKTFGRLFGKALQAQSAIAVANTVLTALGMLILRISNWAFLSLFVFLWSFVPVAGVFISTVPIGFVALTDHGLWGVIMVVLMVVIVHAVEAYVLNPFIYSAHLKLHPLAVLAVLVFAEHFLGVWGLLVAVPMSLFLIEYVIKGKPLGEPKAEEVLASNELLLVGQDGLPLSRPAIS